MMMMIPPLHLPPPNLSNPLILQPRILIIPYTVNRRVDITSDGFPRAVDYAYAFFDFVGEGVGGVVVIGRGGRGKGTRMGMCVVC